MIVWLASYPRSGNTLLRTVLKQTLGLDSYGDPEAWGRKLAKAQADPLSPTAHFTGGLRPPSTWEEFYPQATASKELFLVKTHQAPLDAQPALHVVRDGRKAVTSYFHFHKNKHASLERSILQLIGGEDVYSDWTSHYETWQSHAGPRLELRFEDLVVASDSLLRQIAEFIGHQGPVQAWQNPFEILHELEPTKFREGRTEWTDPEEWGAGEEWAFCKLHGPLMSALGYDAAPKWSGSPPANHSHVAEQVLLALRNRPEGTFVQRSLLAQNWIHQMEAVKASTNGLSHHSRRIPPMPPRPELNGIRAKHPENSTVYLIDQGYKRAIPDAQTYNGLFRDWKGIVTDIDLDRVPDGPNLTGSNILVQVGAGGQAYLIDSNMKRPLEGEGTFDAFHFDSKKVHLVPAVLLEPFSQGRPVSGGVRQEVEGG